MSKSPKILGLNDSFHSTLTFWGRGSRITKSPLKVHRSDPVLCTNLSEKTLVQELFWQPLSTHLQNLDLRLFDAWKKFKQQSYPKWWFYGDFHPMVPSEKLTNKKQIQEENRLQEFYQNGNNNFNDHLQHTLSPIIMEVENGGVEHDFSLQGGHFPLP